VLSTISDPTRIDTLGSDYAMTWLAQAWLGHAWLAEADGDDAAVTGHLATAFATIGRLYLGPFVAQRVLCPGLLIAATHARSSRDAARAVTIVAGTRTALRSFGAIAPPPVARQEQELLDKTRGELSAEEFERAMADGSEMDLPGVLRLAGLPSSPVWEQPPHKGKDGRLDVGAR
jgi:hypothetical protein